MSWEKIKEFIATLSLQKVLPALLILVAGFLVVKLLLRLFDRALNRSRLDKTMFTIVKAVMRVLLYTIVLLVAVGSLGVDVTSLVAVLSVVSLAVSLAVQNVLTNVVGGVTLLTTHPFKVGDSVQVGGDSGVVKEIGLHYTKINTFNGELVYIPNSEVVSSRICNFSVEGKRRIVLTATASYDADIDLVKEALLQAASHPKALQEPATAVYVNNYLDSSVEYLLHVWVNAQDYADVKFAVNEAIKRRFDEKGISIPYPQMDVHLSK